jgi:hypothetical protein
MGEGGYRQMTFSKQKEIGTSRTQRKRKIICKQMGRDRLEYFGEQKLYKTKM